MLCCRTLSTQCCQCCQKINKFRIVKNWYRKVTLGRKNLKLLSAQKFQFSSPSRLSFKSVNIYLFLLCLFLCFLIFSLENNSACCTDGNPGSGPTLLATLAPQSPHKMQSQLHFHPTRI